MERQEAIYGVECPAHIKIEITDLREEIARIEILLGNSLSSDTGEQSLYSIAHPVAREIAALSEQLSDAEARTDWAKWTKIGVRILALDPNHQPTRYAIASVFYKRGLELRTDKKYDAAIRSFSKSIHFVQDNANYFAERAFTYYLKNDYYNSITDYNRAIEIDKNDARYYEGRGSSYEIAALFHHPIGSYSHAISDLNRAIELAPDNADYYHARGAIHSNKRDLKRAIIDFNRAIEINPYYSAAYYSRGFAYVRCLKYQLALEDYNKAIEIDSLDGTFYAFRGNTYLDMGQVDAARRDYEQAIALGYVRAERDIEKLLLKYYKKRT